MSHTEITTKFNSILSTFFGSSEKEKIDNTEIVLKQGNKIFYISHGEWKHEDISFNITDEDISLFQQSIIQEKYLGEDSMLDNFYKEFKEKGHANYSYVYEGIPLRINWSVGMGKSYMRIRKLPSNMFTPEELGVPQVIIDEVRKYKEGGFIVVSARPGSGKSTTIASVLQKIFNEEKTINAITLEDPIEYLYNQDTNSIIEQREKIFDFDDFPTGVEACMRQTPDIVFVQEMTNKEIVRQVMDLAEKGVLVITTLHTSDATSIFESIVGAYDSNRRKEILGKLSTLFRCFISQKLIRRKSGKGKVAVFEVLVNNNESKGYILDDKTENLHQIMVREPNILMSQSILEKIEEEEISLKDGLSSCPYSRQADLKRIIGI